MGRRSSAVSVISSPSFLVFRTSFTIFHRHRVTITASTVYIKMIQLPLTVNSVRGMGSSQ